MIPMDRVVSRLDDYYSHNDTDSAERHLLYWAKEAEATHDCRAMLTLSSELMGFYRKAGKEAEAVSYAEKALSLIRSENLADTVSGGTLLINCATVYTAFSHPEMALPLFEEARKNYEKNLASPSDLLGSLYNNLSLCLLSLARYEEAAEFSKKALGEMEQIDGSEPEQAISHLNLANILEAMHGPENAADAITACVEKAISLLDGEKATHDGNYAFVCTKCAPSFDYYGYFAYAAELRERAASIYAGT